MWYRRAAQQGNAIAQTNIGVLYYSGRGVIQDDAHAVEWLQKAALQQQATAERYLGVYHFEGRGGLPRDEVASGAAEWQRRAGGRVS